MARTELRMVALRSNPRRRSSMTAVARDAANDSGAPTVSLGPAMADDLRHGDVGRLLAALEPALDAIAAPAFLLSRSGEILCSNAQARALPAPSGNAWAWNLTPVAGGEPIAILAILQAPPPEPAPEESLRAMRSRWKLTARQAEVLELVVRGLTNELIAETLGIGIGTVEFHLSAIFDKAGVSNRATLISRVVVGGRQR